MRFTPTINIITNDTCNVYVKDTSAYLPENMSAGKHQFKYSDTGSIDVLRHNKLQETMGSDYKLNYYEVDTDDDLKDISFSSDIEAEKIIRLICIKNDKNYKKQNLRLGVITIDLSDIKDKNGNSLYKDVLEKAKEVYKNELCDIQS